MGIWEILGIEQTNDEETIKSAYRSQLTVYHPEEDPEGFQRLREAYNQALDEINKEEEIDDSEVGKWVEKVANVYEDFSKRINIECWKELLTDDVCLGLDTAFEACEKFLVYMMDHYRIPHEVLALFAEHFCWFEKKEELLAMFPENFIDYVFSNAQYSDRIRYDLFKPEEGKDYEAFIGLYLNLFADVDQGNKEEAQKTLASLLETGIIHPDLTILQVRIALMDENYEEACTLSQNLVKDYPDDRQAIYSCAQAQAANGQMEEAKANYQRLLDQNREDVGALVGMGNYYNDKEDFFEALNYFKEAEVLSPYNGYIYRSIFHCNKEMSVKYLEELEKDPQNRELLWKAVKALINAQEYDKTIEVLKPIEPLEEEKEEYYHIMADAYDGLSDYKTSIEYFNKLIEVTSKKAVIYAELGLAYNELGEHEKAIEAYDKGFQEDSSYIKLYYRKASSLIEMEQYNEALNMCDEGLKLEPELPNLFYYKAEILYHLGEYKQAVDYCDLALDQVFYGEAHMIKIRIYYETEQYEEALNIIERLIENEYENSEMMMYYGKVLAKLERYEESIKIFQDLIEKEKKEQYYYELAINYYETKEYDKALENVNIAIEKEPEEDNKYYFKASLYTRMKKYKEALALYQKFVDDNKADDYEYCKMADIYNRMEDYDQSVSLYLKAIEINPENTYAHSELADVYENMQNFEKALEHMNLQLDISQRVYYFLQRGYFHMNLGHDQEALDDYGEVIRLNDDNGYAYNNMGCIYRDQGNLAEGAVYFQKAIECTTPIHQWFYNLARCLRRLGKYDEAISWLKKGVELFPEENNFYDLMARISSSADKEKDSIAYMKEYEKSCDNKDYVYAEMGDYYADMDEFDKAVEFYKQAIQADKKSPKGYRALGVFYYDHKEDWKHAVKYLKKAYQLEKDSEYTLYHLGLAYVKLGKKKEAEKYFKLGLAISEDDMEKYPSYACGFEQAGQFYYQLGEYEKALKVLQIAIDKAVAYSKCPRSGCFDAYEDMAKVYIAMGKDEEALEAYEKALSIKEDEDYEKEIKRLKEKLNK